MNPYRDYLSKQAAFKMPKLPVAAHEALAGAAVGSTPGAIAGIISDRPDETGQHHYLRSAVAGSAAGAALGAAGAAGVGKMLRGRMASNLKNTRDHIGNVDAAIDKHMLAGNYGLAGESFDQLGRLNQGVKHMEGRVSQPFAGHAQQLAARFKK